MKNQTRRAAKKNTQHKVTARPKKLTDLQKRTVDIYFSMRKSNRGKAYELAGSECRGETATTEAKRMFKLPKVAAYYNSLRKRATERAKRTADEIIAELEKVGFQRTKNRNKVRALEVLAKRFNLFPNRHELTGKDGGPIQYNLSVTKTYKKK